MPDGDTAAPREAAAAPAPSPAEAATADIPAAPAPPDFAAEVAPVIENEPAPETPLSDPAAEVDAMEPPQIGPTEGTSIDFDSFPKLDIAPPGSDFSDNAPAPPELATETAAPEPELTARQDGDQPTTGAPGRRRRRGILAPIAVAAAVAVVFVGGAILLQPQITRLVPAAASLYARVGLHSNIPGLGLTIAEPKIGGSRENLEIVGTIRNDTKKPIDIPVMQARLLDRDGAPLNVWLFQASKPNIAAGGTVEYRTEFRNPPAKAERLDITFTSKKHVPGGAPELARNPAPDAKKSSDAKAPSVHDKPSVDEK